MKINNSLQLEDYLVELLKKALDDTMEAFLNKLDEIIEEKVYEGYIGEWAVQDMRTNQFKESWDKTTAYISSNIISASINQNISIMKQDFENKVHIDRDNLANIIETGIGYNFGYCQDRPYWSEFLKYIETEGYTVFQKKCAKYGIQGNFI